MKLPKYIRWLKFYFSQTPFYTIFYITSKCNARCSHCFNWKLVDEAPNRKELSLEEIEKIAKNWGSMLFLNLSGGEPYLRDDLIDIIELFKKYTGVDMVGIPSNGFSTEKIVNTAEKILQKYPKIHFRFSFSIDGIGEMHDKIRGVPGGFDKVIETVKQVKKLKNKYKNFSLITNTCFMKTNQDKVMEVLDFIKKNLDVDSMSMTFIRGDARSKDNKENLYIEKYKKATEYLSKLNRNKFKNHPLSGFIWGATITAREKVFENLTTRKRNFNCYAIKKMIVLEDDGKIKICEILPTSLGNLRDFDYDINKIVKSDFAKKEYEKIKNKQCNCTWECAIRTGIIFNPKEYLSILKHSLWK
ncbi:radical SAM protein [Patescibacteria group bacterium]